MIDVTRFNDGLYHGLRGVNDSLARLDEAKFVDPFSRNYPLFQLGTRSDIFRFQSGKDEQLSSRGIAIIKASTLWLKQRFGWDLFIGIQFADSYLAQEFRHPIRKHYWVCVGNSKYE